MTLPAAPLFFSPHFEEKIWGGRRLATQLGKNLPANRLIGESWELSATGNAHTPVIDGSLAGTTLASLYADAPVELVGHHVAMPTGFPLLIKFIDANNRLSIQVHPDDKTARECYGEPFGKTECWYIADAGSRGAIGIGLRRSVTRQELRDSVASGAIEGLLNTVRVKTGEMYFIPAGTIHAILDDLIIYEVQQNSNATFRLYDWNRVDATGKPRPLHLEESIACANLSMQGSYRIEPIEVCTAPYRRLIRIACPYFTVEEIITERPVEIRLAAAASCRILTVFSGCPTLRWIGGHRKTVQGQTLLLPANLDIATVDTSEERCRFLLTTIPAGYDEFAAPLLAAGYTSADIKALGYL